jgi:transmembrane sensor
MGSHAHKDPDLTLARAILRESGAAVAGDPVLPVLLAYRDGVAPHGIEPARRERIWTEVEAGIGRLPERSPALRLITVRRFIIAAAASVLVVLTIGYLVHPSPEPARLIAESAGQMVMVSLDDGSEVTLRPYSRLTRDGERRYQVEGEAVFMVRQVDGPSFEVTAANGRVTVVGTVFGIATWSGTVRVHVTEGVVRFAPQARGPAVMVRAGETRSLLGDGVAPAPVHEEEPLAWMHGELMLDRRSLGSVVAELEHHYGIRLEGPLPSEATFSGRLQLGELEAVLEDLGIVLEGRFERIGPGRYRFLPA